jgi:hypothetical protein
VKEGREEVAGEEEEEDDRMGLMEISRMKMPRTLHSEHASVEERSESASSVESEASTSQLTDEASPLQSDYIGPDPAPPNPQTARTSRRGTHSGSPALLATSSPLAPPRAP